jgi:hypothetical protein
MLGTSLQKRLRIEALEEKVPLAGDVAINFIDGDLVITGDAADNSFAFEQASLFAGHQFRIKGTEQTNINGVTDEWIYFDGLTRDLLIDLGDGSDTIHAYGVPGEGDRLPLAVPRDMIINMGSGDDHLVLGVTATEEFGAPAVYQSPVAVGRDVTINLGTGDDLFLIASTLVGDDLSIADSGGSTTILSWPSYIWQFPRVESSIGDDLNVSLSSGDDLVDFNEFTIGGDVTFNLSGGNDSAWLQDFSTGGSVLVNAGAGVNDVHIGTGTVGGGILLTGSGANLFQADALEIASSIVLLGGNGDDQFYVGTVNAGSAIITTAGGADYVQLTDSAFNLLTVSLGSGGDTLSLDGVSSILAVLLGGGGSDTLLESADTSFLLAIDLSFETFGEI